MNTRFDTRTSLVVTKGFDALKVNDIEKAFTIWTDPSIPVIKDNASILIDTMPSVINKTAGKCIGYLVIKTLPVSNNTKIIYVESQHESGALFWRLTVHQTPIKPVITSIDFNTDPIKINLFPIDPGVFRSR